MSKRSLLITLLLVSFLAMPLMADIVFLMRPDKIDEHTAENADQPFVDKLEDAGYTVTTWYSTNIAEESASTIAMLNEADLIIVGRGGSSGVYGGDNKDVYNGLSAPIMALHGWTARNNRMNWFDSRSIAHVGDGVTPDSLMAIVLDAADAAFAGVTIPADNIIPWHTNEYDVLTTEAGNATVLATTDTAANQVLFARFESGTEFYEGAGDYPSAPRTYLNIGADFITGADGLTQYNYYQWTEESEQVWLNEVELMINADYDYVPQPKNIVFVRRPDKIDEHTGENADKPFIDKLIEAGHTVDVFYSTDLQSVHKDTLAAVNAADVIVIGRGGSSGIFGGDNKVHWNGLKVPMIALHGWACRSNRQNWFNSTSISHVGDGSENVLNAIVLDAADAAFDGVDVPADGIIPWHTNEYDVLNTEAGNADVLATVDTAANQVLFARFETGVEYYEGAGDYPSAPRSYLNCGADFITGADGLTQFNYYQWTEESEQVWLNEVNVICDLGYDYTHQPYNIVFIERPDKIDEHTGENADQPFIDKLEEVGHIVTPMYSTGIAGEHWSFIDSLNAADLIVVGRGGSSGIFGGDNKQTWNALTVPMLALHGWACRSNRMNWFNSTSIAHVGDGSENVMNAIVLDADDDAFEGVDVPEDGIIPWHTNEYDVLTTEPGNADVLATVDTAETQILFARFETGDEYYDDAVDFPSAPRTYLNAGADFLTAADGLTQYNYYQWTEESEKVWLNEVDIMGGMDFDAAPYPKVIAFVVRPDKIDEHTAENADQPFIDKLEDEGYIVWQMYTTDIPNADEAWMDSLDAADLVMLGRSGSSGIYGGDNKPYWNNIDSPILALHGWACRSSRLNWFNSTSITHVGDGVTPDTLVAVVEDANDAAFEGVDISAEGTIPWQINEYDVLTTEAGNFDVLATPLDSTAEILFARNEDVGEEFYEGSSDYPSAPVSYLNVGADFITGADGLTQFNYYQWTEEAEQVWLNETALMADARYDYVAQPDTLVGVESNLRVAKAFELRQNYPNPFNPTTTIEFALDAPGKTTLTIYNVMGQMVETLVDRDMTVGNHTVDFKASQYSTGVYFYRLQAGSKTLVKKMMLIK